MYFIVNRSYPTKLKPSGAFFDRLNSIISVIACEARLFRDNL